MLFVGDTGASDVYAIERTGQLQRFTNIRADAVVHFVVCRMVFAPGDDKVDMWVDPPPGADDPSESSIAVSAMVRDFRFNRVRLCSAPVPMDFDTLCLGTKFSDLSVTPGRRSLSNLTPPRASWTLLALGVMLAFGGIFLLSILLWALSRRKRREPPLVR